MESEAVAMEVARQHTPRPAHVKNIHLKLDVNEILKAKMSGPVRDLVPGFQHHEQVIGFDEAQRLGLVNKQLAMPASRDMLDSLRRELVTHGRDMIARLEQSLDAPPERKDCSSMIAQLEQQFQLHGGYVRVVRCQ